MSKKYDKICEHEDCTACMACANICPHNAIEIYTSGIGFKYPHIDLSHCVNCGLCRLVCPAINNRQLVFPEKCFAVKLKDEASHSNCASGGAATAFAQVILRKCGVVVGCSGEDMHNVSHIIIESEADLYKLQGSKYVQSDISVNLFIKVRRSLMDGKIVLFIGTGCQTAGLQNFLMKNYENLITVDLVCHGVPSQKMLNDNIKSYADIDANSIKFRIKELGADNYKIRYGWSYNRVMGNDSKRVFIPSTKDCYMSAFLDLLTFRECCYRCKYAYSARQSDLTICDFWGLGTEQYSQFKSSEGVNAVLVVSEKGYKLFKDANDYLNFEERPIQEAIEGNKQLQRPSKRNPLRKKFDRIYKNQGFSAAVRKTTMRNNQLKRIFLIPGKIMALIAAPLNIKM